MVRWAYLNGALLCCAATLAVAQAPARATDPVFVRAQGLVSDGNGAAGRALIDSVIKATSPTARLYPEALFWRASLASNAADAESDYKHIVVDYPLAPQAEDALAASGTARACAWRSRRRAYPPSADPARLPPQQITGDGRATGLPGCYSRKTISRMPARRMQAHSPRREMRK